MLLYWVLEAHNFYSTIILFPKSYKKNLVNFR